MTIKANKIHLSFAFLVLSMHGIYAQKIEKDNLLKIWYLDKYADEEDYYKVPKIEQGDYIHLKEDMTYEAQTESETGTGTWMLNTNGTYLELKGDNGDKEKIYILYSTVRTLVVMYDTDEYRELEAHYVSCK